MRLVHLTKFASMTLASMTVFTVSAPVQAFTYTSEFIYTWKGCETTCAQISPSLRYTDDQINLFRQRMNRFGHFNKHHYQNTLWASDVLEDNGFRGEDFRVADDVDIYAYSGHGDARSNNWGQTFLIPMCFSGTSRSCLVDIEEARLGEYFGGYETPSAGQMRWGLFATCHSVDTAPDQQWLQTMWFGLEYVQGYRGLSADSQKTDEVMEDWVNSAISAGDSFKRAWFWAAEDWWIDDTASLIAPGRRVSDAINRRDHQKADWPRNLSFLTNLSAAWAWHEG